MESGGDGEVGVGGHDEERRFQNDQRPGAFIKSNRIDKIHFACDLATFKHCLINSRNKSGDFLFIGIILGTEYVTEPSFFNLKLTHEAISHATEAE